MPSHVQYANERELAPTKHNDNRLKNEPAEHDSAVAEVSLLSDWKIIFLERKKFTEMEISVL